MRKLITPKNILFVGVFLASLLPNLYMSFKGNTFYDIKTYFMMASGLSGAIYVDLQEDYKSLPKGIWVFWLFAAFSWINAYIIKVAAYSNFLNPELIGGSLGSSFLFTLVFGFGFFIGYEVNNYRKKKVDKDDTVHKK